MSVMARFCLLGNFMWQRLRNDRLFLVLLMALVALAWLSLWVWGQSPYGRFLDHEALTDVSNEDVGLLVFFVAGWTLMVFAMMLPTSLPLISLFHTMTRDRSHNTRLVALLIAGYLVVWMGFGVVVHLGDLAVHEGVELNGWLDSNYWVIGAGILMVAGVYQFTPLKYHCLDKCRSPFSFIAGHWSGGSESIQSLRLGLDHGLFCVGCCWSLMLLMFGVGAGNLGWMLVLGAVMAIEKNMPWGRRLSAPLGAALICWGLATVIYHISPGDLTPGNEPSASARRRLHQENRYHAGRTEWLSTIPTNGKNSWRPETSSKPPTSTT